MKIKMRNNELCFFSFLFKIINITRMKLLANTTSTTITLQRKSNPYVIFGGSPVLSFRIEIGAKISVYNSR